MVTKSFVIGQCIAHPEPTTKESKSQYFKRIKKCKNQHQKLFAKSRACAYCISNVSYRQRKCEARISNLATESSCVMIDIRINRK